MSKDIWIQKILKIKIILGSKNLRKVYKFVGSKYAIAVNSATSGLHSALEACNLEPGDEVISPGLTVVMNSFVTLAGNYVPVFADVNPQTWNIDIETILPKLQKKLK